MEHPQQRTIYGSISSRQPNRPTLEFSRLHRPQGHDQQAREQEGAGELCLG